MVVEEQEKGSGNIYLLISAPSFPWYADLSHQDCWEEFKQLWLLPEVSPGRFNFKLWSIYLPSDANRLIIKIIALVAA